VAILCPHWNKLLAASILPRGAPYADGFLRIRDPSSHLSWPAALPAAELAIFACDFGLLEPRPGLPAPSLCPGAFARRPRHPCGSPADARDRHHLREALLAQSGGLRPVDDGAGPSRGFGAAGP